MTLKYQYSLFLTSHITEIGNFVRYRHKILTFTGRFDVIFDRQAETNTPLQPRLKTNGCGGFKSYGNNLPVALLVQLTLDTLRHNPPCFEFLVLILKQEGNNVMLTSLTVKRVRVGVNCLCCRIGRKNVFKSSMISGYSVYDRRVFL